MRACLEGLIVAPSARAPGCLQGDEPKRLEEVPYPSTQGVRTESCGVHEVFQDAQKIPGGGGPCGRASSGHSKGHQRVQSPEVERDPLSMFLPGWTKDMAERSLHGSALGCDDYTGGHAMLNRSDSSMQMVILAPLAKAPETPCLEKMFRHER